MPALLYLDGENLHWSLTNHHNRDLDPGVVLHLASALGEIREARLYADFSRFPRQVATRALALGVEPVHVPSYPNGNGDSKGKSTTDQRLTLDCLERILTGPRADTVILAAGDGDYIHLVHKLQSRRVKVVVIGVANTLSWLLRDAADAVHCYPVPLPEMAEQGLAYPAQEARLAAAPTPSTAEGAGPAESQPLTEKDRRIFVDILRGCAQPILYVPLFKTLQEQKRAGALPVSNRQLKQLLHEAVTAGTVVREECEGLAYYRLAG